jgi:hypothetical protein
MTTVEARMPSPSTSSPKSTTGEWVTEKITGVAISKTPPVRSMMMAMPANFCRSMSGL